MGVRPICISIFIYSRAFIWLSRLSGEEDVVFGSPASLRDHEVFGKLIGFFVNTVVWRQIVILQKVIIRQYAVVKTNDFFFKTQNLFILTTTYCHMIAVCNMTVYSCTTVYCRMTSNCCMPARRFFLTTRFMNKYHLEYRLHFF